MKKALFAYLFIFMISISTLYSTTQKTFSIDSSEWKAAAALCMSAGVLPPSSVSPTTGEEILNALGRIDEARLTENEKAMLERLREKLDWTPMLNTEYFGADANVILAPEFYVHTSNDVDRSMDYLFPKKDRLNLLDFSFKMNFADVGYGFVNYLALSPMHLNQYDKTWGTNVDALKDGLEMVHEGVLDAGILFGNKWMNFSVASTGQSLGYGKNGNLGISDNFMRQQYMRFHTFSRYFDYTLNITRYNSLVENQSSAEGFQNFNGKQQIFPVHRFEVKLFDKLQLVFQEQTMMYIDNAFDIRLLNPFIVFHGFNNYGDGINVSNGDQANNSIILELGYTVIPHLRINGQFIIDQITLPGEIRGEDDTRPNAFGALLNVESSWILEKYFLNAWLETSYMSPYVYLNNKLDESGQNYNFDYIVGYDIWGGNDDINYTGYKYGPDSIVLSIGADFGDLDRFLLSGSLTYVIHGKYGLGYQTMIAAMGPDHINDLTPSTATPEHRLEALIEAVYKPIEGLEISSGLGIVQIWNRKCTQGDNLTDMQFKIGVKFDPVAMFC